MNNDLVLLNTEVLDESVSNAIGSPIGAGRGAGRVSSLPKGAGKYSGFTNESLLDGLTENTSLLNADGYSNYVTPEMVKASIDLTTTAVKAGSASKERRAEGSCVRPAMAESFINRKKWAEYNKCKEQQAKDDERAAQIESQRTERERIALERARIGESSGDKFLGMPKAVGITVAVVGGLALVVGGIFLVKKLRK
jgi:hypothetical protein